MRFNRLQDWLDWQLKLHPTSIELGLERVKHVATKLGIDSSAFAGSKSTVITVAGTNGKGSCVKTLEALLLKAGKSVGSFTSPHILRYNERIRINDHQVNDEQLCRAFSTIDIAREDTSLTYFEFSTLAALLLLQQAKVEYVLLEVGLGGRLDSTNIIDTDLAIITSIDIDHCDYLGYDRESIGREKSGIFRSGVAAINADPSPPESMHQVAKTLGVKLYSSNRDFTWSISDGQFHWQCLLTEPSNLSTVTAELPKLPLPSVSSALMALELLKIHLPKQDVIEVLEQVTLVGRSQSVIVDGIEFVLDVAHNPAAAQSLAKSVESRSEPKCYAICAMMSDKDVNSVLRPLINGIDTWLLPDLSGNTRSLSANELRDEVLLINKNSNIRQLSSVADAIDSIRQQFVNISEKPVVFVFGSFFTVEAALNYFQIPVK